MARKKEFDVNGKKMTARELTAGQIRELLESADDAGEASIVDIMYPERIPAAAAAMSVGKKLAALEKMAPSELDPIMEAATLVNPSLAALIKRLAKVGAAAMQAKSSTGASAG